MAKRFGLPRFLSAIVAFAPVKRWRRRIARAIFWLGAAGVCTFALGLASVFLYLNPQIPSTDTYRHYRYETPLQIFTADQLLIGEFGERRLYPVALDDVPRHFLNALINTEDKRFYDHAGIDLISLANDLVGLITSPDVRTGASTLTMQLAKIVSFSHRQEFIRKFKEMLLALQVERELSKDEILELYVNIMAFGKHAYGVQAAAHTYYGKPVGELNLAQLAMLAGVIKKPEGGNPINGPEWALARRDLVLRRMRHLGSINQAEYEQAVAMPITAQVFQREIDLSAPYPAEWVRRELFERYGQDIYSGFIAHTTLNSKLQATAQQAVRRGLVAYDRRRGYRGAEDRVDIVTLANGEVDLDAAAAALAHTRTIGGLVPAIVVDVGEDRAIAVRRTAELAEVPWAGLRWARPFLGLDSIGARPKTAADVVAVGDLIRIEQHEAEWRLGQLPDIQGALVALDPKNGAVRALVGGWDFHSMQFNHALQARRQPGSGFKPFVYSAALANGLTPASVFWDSPLVFDDANLETVYRPRNDSGEFSNRPMRLREALYRSRNVVSMRMMRHVRAQPIVDHVQRFGFEAAALPRNTQLAIGGGNMATTPIEMARAYTVFANGGLRIEPHVIDRVERLDGSVLVQARHPSVCDPCDSEGDPDAALLAAERVLDERNAFIMDTMLRDVIQRGTGRRARDALRRPDIAGKTGTTDEAADTWFNGYHRSLVASVWVGFADHRPLGEGVFGSNTPLPIWIDFMREALAEEPVEEPLRPTGVISVKVDPSSGRAAAADNANAIFEYFFADNPPRKQAGDGLARSNSSSGVLPEDIF